ncbi:MAG TPA: DUF1360 domain-containing protein [Candidatus Paceibacterota bacterium]
MKQKLYKWLTIDMAVFILINAVLLYFFNDALESLKDITAFHLIILGFAAYRAANILSNEAITKPIRAPFVKEVVKDGVPTEEPKKSGFKGAMGLLIYCPSCTGVWLSAVLIYSYALWPTPTFVIALFLTLSAIERIIARILGSIKKPR